MPVQGGTLTHKLYKYKTKRRQPYTIQAAIAKTNLIQIQLQRNNNNLTQILQ